MDVLNVVASFAIVCTVGMIVVLWPVETMYTIASAHKEALFYITRKGRWLRVYEQATNGCLQGMKLPFGCREVGISRRGLTTFVVDRHKRVHFYDSYSLEEFCVTKPVPRIDFVMFDETDHEAWICLNDDTKITLQLN